MTRYRALVLPTLWLALLAAPATSAEIRLRRNCEPQGPLVLLGDVAEVLANDAGTVKELSAVELVPSPPPGAHRYLRVREIQDLLDARRVNLIDHRFSGASQVLVEVVVEPAEPAKPAEVIPSPTAIDPKQVDVRAVQAITSYLVSRGSQPGPWTVEVNLDEAAQRTLAGAAGKISVQGGRAPWMGHQRFELLFESSMGGNRLPVDANVSVPVSVVAAVRSLPRGAIVRKADVELRPAASFGAAGQPVRGLRSIDEVVGMETTRAVALGQVLDEQYVRRPLLVARGDAVTVYARSAGLQVRTTARATENGSQGDLITVESLLDRRRFFARVSGVQEVEVFARAVAAAGPGSGSANVGLDQ